VLPAAREPSIAISALEALPGRANQAIIFLRDASLARPGSRGDRLRLNANFRKPFRLIWVVQSPVAEINCFSPRAIDGYFRPVPPRQEGRMRYRHETRGGMRWTRHVRTTDDVVRGRRSRVVLTPRRWCQVCGMAMSALTGATRRAGDGDNKARSPRRVRRKPLKPLRRECRV
jgi:hypothetical protein